MDVYAVVWDVSFEGGEVDTIWTTKEAADLRCAALNARAHDRGPWAVEAYTLDPVDKPV